MAAARKMPSAKRIKQKLLTKKSKAKKLLLRAKNNLGTARRRIVGTAKNDLRIARSKLNKMYTRSLRGIKTKSKEIKNNVADYTSEKPIETLGTAISLSLVSGLVIGFVAGNKFIRDKIRSI